MQLYIPSSFKCSIKTPRCTLSTVYSSSSRSQSVQQFQFFSSKLSKAFLSHNLPTCRWSSAFLGRLGWAGQGIPHLATHPVEAAVHLTILRVTIPRLQLSHPVGISVLIHLPALFRKILSPLLVQLHVDWMITLLKLSASHARCMKIKEQSTLLISLRPVSMSWRPAMMNPLLFMRAFPMKSMACVFSPRFFCWAWLTNFFIGQKSIGYPTARNTASTAQSTLIQPSLRFILPPRSMITSDTWIFKKINIFRRLADTRKSKRDINFTLKIIKIISESINLILIRMLMFFFPNLFGATNQSETAAMTSSVKLIDCATAFLDCRTVRFFLNFPTFCWLFYRGTYSRVTELHQSPVDDQFLSASVDKTVRLWDHRSGCTGMLTNLDTTPTLTIDPEGLIFAAGHCTTHENRIMLYDIRNYQKVSQKF